MNRLSSKIDRLPETVELVLEAHLAELEGAIVASGSRDVVAVGSGGSAIAAIYFARCRETLFGRSTSVVTAMEFVVGAADLSGSDVWFFSAAADNPDIVAAVAAARSRGAASANMVTRNSDGAAARHLSSRGGAFVHLVPVADAKDGFLATHSMVASSAALLLASDAVSPDPIGVGLRSAYKAGIEAAVSAAARRRAAEAFAGLGRDDVLIILHDPQAAAIATLVETSVWEASICAVQRTDFRNFAHGRHSWLHHRPERSFVLALTGAETQDAWSRIEAPLSAQIRRAAYQFGDCGRFRIALGLVEGLVLVDAMGVAVGVDPGKPGVGDFGRAIYGDEALPALAGRLRPSVRQKRAALLARDDPEQTAGSACGGDESHMDRLAATPIGAIVLDYDGTVVTTEGRLEPPEQLLLDELVRLHGIGVAIAFATGRGGSAGEMLRVALPGSVHPSILMGYYNGGYLQPLDVNLEEAPAPPHPAIEETAAWLTRHQELLRSGTGWRNSGVQITIRLAALEDEDRFLTKLRQCGPVATGDVKLARSGHSLDLILASTTKLAVVERVKERVQADAAILCVGDSGARGGNDNELLAHGHGVSVGTVCGRMDGCWSLFGHEATGPDALLRLLRALQPAGPGLVRLNTAELALDTSPEVGTNREHGH
jgi:fructoselysine-6-P-deglycase FrlB-like protein